MNVFDEYLKRKASEEDIEVPESVKKRIELTLSDLPEKGNAVKRVRVLPRIASAAACFIFITLLLLPNVSVSYARALEKIPVIGEIVQVVSIRNYFYSDDMHEMDIDVPKIEADNSDAADYINKDIDELTKTLVDRFYYDLESIGNDAHGSVYVDYETVTDTDKWFTLKIRVHEAVGSSNTYFKFYHINKLNNKIVQLGDLAANESFYDVLEKEIKRQMQIRMEEDSNLVYWSDDSIIGKDFVTLAPDNNFYFGENGDLVIVFDKYEVAPGYMGTPEFAIGKDVIKDILAPEFVYLAS